MKQCEGSLDKEICFEEIPDGARWCDPCAIDLQGGPEMPPMDHPSWAKLQAELDAEFPAEGRKFDKAMVELLKRARRAKPAVEYFWMHPDTFKALEAQSAARVQAELGGPRYVTTQAGTPIVADPSMPVHHIEAQVDGERIKVWPKP